MKTHKMFTAAVLVLSVFAVLSGCSGGPAAVDSPEAAVPEQVPVVTVQDSSEVQADPEEPPVKDTYTTGTIAELVDAIQTILIDQSGADEFTIEVTRNISVVTPITLAQIVKYYDKSITICGTGGEKTLTLISNGSLFTVGNGLTFILDRDITLKGFDYNTAALVSVARGGKLVVRDGSKVTGNTNIVSELEGGGVSVQTGGSLVVSGGDISGNVSPFGGGVYMTGGTVTLSGGAVNGNKVASSAKSSTSGGAGFYITGGNFTITGGEIDGNVSSSALGGGVHLTGDAVCTMSGGSISNNSVTASGGGIYISNATMDISGGIISGNRTTSSNGNGGGVYIPQSNSNNKTALTITGGLMSNNSASSGGAIYASNSWYYSGGTEYTYGTVVTMKGGAISGNKADRGGGVYLNQNNFVVSGKSLINGNSAGEGSGVYVNQAAIVLSEEGRITDNAVCLSYPGTRHQSAIYIAGEIPGNDEVARIELRGSSAVTGAAQWDQKILKHYSPYTGELPTTRFTVDRFIPASVTAANPIVPITGYQINSEGDLTGK